VRAAAARTDPDHARLTAPFGVVGVRIAGEGAEAALATVTYLAPGTKPAAPTHALAERFAREFERYLDDPAYRFGLRCAPRGTAFQQRVWAAISAIASGATRRYGEIATDLGSSARAVGQACGDNPLPLVVPCHRVVAAAGPGGFAHASDGWLLRTKHWLLAHERRERTLV
jgi:methylated-DNA-[protein]-cysteine S-methyltransferase